MYALIKIKRITDSNLDAFQNWINLQLQIPIIFINSSKPTAQTSSLYNMVSLLVKSKRKVDRNLLEHSASQTPKYFQEEYKQKFKLGFKQIGKNAEQVMLKVRDKTTMHEDTIDQKLFYVCMAKAISESKRANR